MFYLRVLCPFLLVFTSLLAGCEALPLGQSSGAQQTTTPLPTADNLGFQPVIPQSCLVADVGSMQTDRRQGNLIAWQPDSHLLAYVAPQSSTNWYVGGVSLANEPDYKKRIPLGGNTLSSGDLTWSPDGSRLAFLAFRMNESIQTVMVVSPDGSELIDLFPQDAARSDQRSSQKSILQWTSPTTVEVVSSCGEDCQQPESIDVLTGEASPGIAKERKSDNRLLDRADVKILDGLDPYQNVITYDPKLYPRGFSSPNWSPDLTQVLYIDRHGLLWNLTPDTKQQYVLDIGLRVVNETQWSSDGKMVAVRAEDRIFIFEVPCVSKQP